MATQVCGLPLALNLPSITLLVYYQVICTTVVTTVPGIKTVNEKQNGARKATAT